MSATKRALVTGGAGFVGANLVRRLLRDGHEIHLLVRQSGTAWRLNELAGDVQFHPGDIADSANVRAILTAVRPQWVFHLAAYGAYPDQTDAGRILSTNVCGTAALADASLENGVEMFLHTGSSSEYGLKDHAAREDELLEPNSAYAVGKAAATHYCRFLARARDFNAVTVRLYSIYGPFEEPARLVPTLLLRALEGGLPPLAGPRTARDFVYVDDAVDAMLHLAGGPPPRGAIYNICTGIQSDLRSIVAEVRSLLGVQAEPVWSTMPARPWDTDIWSGDPSRILRETGWKAETTLRAGLERTLRWFRESPRWAAYYAGRILKK